jgi:hypothetical protein
MASRIDPTSEPVKSEIRSGRQLLSLDRPLPVWIRLYRNRIRLAHPQARPSRPSRDEGFAFLLALPQLTYFCGTTETALA